MQGVGPPPQAQAQAPQGQGYPTPPQPLQLQPQGPQGMMPNAGSPAPWQQQQQQPHAAPQAWQQNPFAPAPQQMTPHGGVPAAGGWTPPGGHRPPEQTATPGYPLLRQGDAQANLQAPIPPPPPTVSEPTKNVRRGPGGLTKALFILVALFMGVGAGYAAFRFLYLPGKLPFLQPSGAFATPVSAGAWRV